MHDDAHRGIPREGYRVVLADLDPVSTGDRETDVIPLHPSQGFPSGLPEKQRDALIAVHGRDIRSGSSSCTTVTPAAAARRGLQLKLWSKRTDDDRRRRPADGSVCTHAARNSLAPGGVSRDQQAHDRGSPNSIPQERTRGRRAAGGRPRPGPITAHADERAGTSRDFGTATNRFPPARTAQRRSLGEAARPVLRAALRYDPPAYRRADPRPWDSGTGARFTHVRQLTGEQLIMARCLMHGG